MPQFLSPNSSQETQYYRTAGSGNIGRREATLPAPSQIVQLFTAEATHVDTVLSEARGPQREPPGLTYLIVCAIRIRPLAAVHSFLLACAI
jgi:hypothetical protein